MGSQARGCTRIAELSLDTYRVMQALEFDDGGGAGQGLERAGWGPGDGSNPAKNILIEPEALEVVAALATLQAELRGLRDEIRTRDVQLAAQELVGSAKAGGGRSSGGSGGGGSRSSFSGGRSSSDGSLGRPGPGMLERTLSRPFGRSRSDGKEVSL